MPNTLEPTSANHSKFIERCFINYSSIAISILNLLSLVAYIWVTLVIEMHICHANCEFTCKILSSLFFANTKVYKFF